MPPNSRPAPRGSEETHSAFPSPRVRLGRLVHWLLPDRRQREQRKLRRIRISYGWGSPTPFRRSRRGNALSNSKTRTRVLTALAVFYLFFCHAVVWAVKHPPLQ